MNLKKYLIVLIGFLFLTTSCKEELENPELTDADLMVYFWGTGDNITGIAWNGYDVLIGETLSLKLQVSPFTDTDIKWVDHVTGEVLSTTLEFTYAPTEEETKRVNFIATRPSGYQKTIPFNFRGNLDGQISIINQWQSFLIPQGVQTGMFTVEFDMVPSKDNMDGVVGILDGVSTTYSDNSCIIRLNPSGKIDAYDENGYAADNELTYHAGVTYHIKMAINTTTMRYDIYATEAGGSEVIIGQDFKFRKQITHLDYWSMSAGDFNITDPGTHRVFNMVITTLTQNEAPVFTPVADIELPEGQVLAVEIEALDPLGGNIVLGAVDLPQFANLVDNGFGHGTITFDPYGDCGGCDLGVYDIHLTATNSVTTTDFHINIEIIDLNTPFNITANAADATVWANGASDFNWAQIFGGHVDAGIGGDDHVVAIMPFPLPEVVAGKRVKSAVLKVNVTENNSWVTVDYDIYAINTRASSEVLSSDFYIGNYDTDVNATAIQQGFIANGLGTGEFIASETAGTNLANFMNTQFTNGATTGQYIFIRVSANKSDMPTWAHLQFDSANVATDTKPVLTVTLEDI